MATRRTSQVEAVTAAIEEFGGTVLGVDWQHRHPRVRFAFKGREMFYVTAGTPGDWRAGENIRSNIRHMMGAVGGPKRVGSRKARKNYADEARPDAPDHITTGGNPFAILDSHALASEVDRLRYRNAWQQFWDAHLYAVGGGPIWWRR
jgi:hypothetical protein